ncbi:MAG: NADH:ubiquinone reductase (Na(+)-transporting) subunit F [Bacteroidales bacterium]|nr:NADH:ubiquinone reductase (Na(+)-transporting) subunit F [Bacteroidales bacterium]MEE1080072.1 NADH:ubiquinone reductase (Na(+)-transporting) subunit F [Bacteroidales bacterium]
MLQTLVPAILVFLAVILILVVLLLVIKAKLVPSGNITVDVNGKKQIETAIGSTALATLQSGGIFLSSACGGGGKCGQCKCIIEEGAGDILPTEVGFFNRKQIKAKYRLACQSKIKENAKIIVPDDVFGVKEWECTVIGNKNVATFIKEYKVALPAGEHMHFEPGSYAQIKIPAFDIDYDKDFDKSLIGDTYLPAWEKFGLFPLKCHNSEPTVRAYSMANYPDEGDIITLNVRIATPPFKPKDQGPGFMDVNPGIASSYIFSLKPGDKVIMSGPYGEFRPQYGTGREMIWVGGGAGMAPLRAQIMHMLKGNGIAPEDRQRPMHYFYGARALEEIPFLDDFLALEKEFPNFHFHLALDRPDPKADAAGIKYTPGFVAPVMGDTYLKAHEAPEDCEYYLCGPPMMAKTVLDLLHSLGVEDDMIRFDNFGG